MMKKRPEDFAAILKIEHRRPRKGDQLLRRSDDWNQGVEFSDCSISKHALLWDGYMRAGAGLIELCLQDEYQGNRNFVIYPILFNYRHGLELAMKWIIVMYGQGKTKVNGHNLWQLWERCRAIVDQYDADDHEGREAVEQIVKDFDNLDKNGVAFRYGWSLNGKKIKLPEHRIDLENIRNVMEGVDNYFTGLDGWLDDLQSAEP